MHKLMSSLALLTAFVVVSLSPGTALAEQVKDSGSIEGTYVKRDVQPIPGQEGHMLLLTESNGTSSNPGGLVDGFSVVVREIADLRQGNGPQQGYVIYSKGSDQLVVRIDGMVTTTMKNDQPNTTFEGKYEFIRGAGTLADIEGEGTYSGYFKSEDDYRVDWQGMRTVQKGAMASPQN